jgi:hypothetical protein
MAMSVVKIGLASRRSRCSKTGMTVIGTAKLPSRRAQIAHFDVRMSMRTPPLPLMPSDYRQGIALV